MCRLSEANGPADSFCNASREFREETGVQKFSRRLKEEPLIPLGELCEESAPGGEGARLGVILSSKSVLSALLQAVLRHATLCTEPTGR